ncbi:MAG: dockerin type I repeat-containing protein, partial [Muribaculaceae bacterium]|nr:dockerin type I repeat-containing protein [Muribaculaceae bacterium]
PIKVKRKGAGGVGIGNMGDYEDNTMLTFEYDATVLYHGNSRLFVKDATGYGLIYGNVGQTYKQGNVIPAGYGGKKTTYGGEPELAATFSGFQPSSGNVTVTPDPATVNDINHEHFAHFVVLSNVDIIEVSGNNFKVKDANGNICNGYNQFGQDVQEGHYDQLKGIVGSYGNTNTVYQLLPLIDAPIVNVRNIPELYALNSGRQGKFTQPLTAIYQNRLNLYVQDIDGNYGMVYGGVPGEFVNGDKIVEPVASWTTYNNYKEIIPADGFTVGSHGTPVEPDEWMIEDISQDMIHAYVKFMDVEVVLDSVNYYRAIDETGEIVLYNQFKLEFPEPEAGATYDVTGFVSLFKGNLQIYPLTIEKVGGGFDCGTQGDVNNDKEMNVADVNALIDIILSGAAGIDECTRWRADVNGDGEINIADVNALIDLILSNH